MIGHVIEPHPAGPALFVEAESVFQMRVELKKGRQTKRVDSAFEPSGVVVNGKRETIMVLDHEWEGPVLPRQRENAPAHEAVW